MLLQSEGRYNYLKQGMWTGLLCGMLTFPNFASHFENLGMRDGSLMEQLSNGILAKRRCAATVHVSTRSHRGCAGSIESCMCRRRLLKGFYPEKHGDVLTTSVITLLPNRSSLVLDISNDYAGYFAGEKKSLPLIIPRPFYSYNVGKGSPHCRKPRRWPITTT